MRGYKYLQCASLALAAALLGGCGVIPAVAQQTTAAALRPFTTAAQAIGTDLQIMGNLARSATAQTALQTRQITSAMTALPAAATPVTYPQTPMMPRINRPMRTEKAPDDWDLLPTDVLSRLTADQVGLQRAAQREAVTAVVGETIFWKLDGREGSATTESESKRGTFTCRTFVQTLTLENSKEKVRATACRTATTGWTRSY